MQQAMVQVSPTHQARTHYLHACSFAMKTADQMCPSRTIATRRHNRAPTRSRPATDPDLGRSSHLRPQRWPTSRPRTMPSRCRMHRALATRQQRSQRTSVFCRRGNLRILSACQRLARPIAPVGRLLRQSSLLTSPRSTIEFLPTQISFTPQTEVSMGLPPDMPVPPLSPSQSSPLPLTLPQHDQPQAVRAFTNNQAWLPLPSTLDFPTNISLPP